MGALVAGAPSGYQIQRAPERPTGVAASDCPFQTAMVETMAASRAVKAAHRRRSGADMATPGEGQESDETFKQCSDHRRWPTSKSIHMTAVSGRGLSEGPPKNCKPSRSGRVLVGVLEW